MSPATHFLIGWAVANAPGLNRRERAAVAVAGVISDVDAAGIAVDFFTRNSVHPTNWWGDYHHVFAHNLLFALAVGAAAYFLASQKWKTAALAFLTFHLHLLGDLVGARGPEGEQWPIHYVWPLTDRVQFTWSGQWALNAWPNFVITGFVLLATFYFAWQRGFSPLEIISQKADHAFVAALHRRFPRSEPAAQR